MKPTVCHRPKAECLDRHDVPDALDSRRAQTEIANEIRRTRYAVQVVEIREGGKQ